MTRGPTSTQNIAINLIFEWMGEERYNRTYEEYMNIAKRLPKITAAHAYVNQRLREFAERGNRPFDAICYFRAGDRKPRYAPFPTSISEETIRKGLEEMGMREPKPRKRKAA